MYVNMYDFSYENHYNTIFCNISTSTWRTNSFKWISIRFWAGSFLRQFNKFSEVSTWHPDIVATAKARLRGIPLGGIAHLHTGTPLSSMALWNRPLLIGDNIWNPILAAPALWPNTVTWLGSPLKWTIFALTQRNASTWSFKP